MGHGLGNAPSGPAATTVRTAFNHAGPGAESSPSPTSTNTLPHIKLDTPSTAEPSPDDTVKRWLPTSSSSASSNRLATPQTPTTGQFRGLSIDIPSKGLSEEIGTDDLKFSVRGSMLFEGKQPTGNTDSVGVDYSNLRHASGIVSVKTMPLIQEPALKGKTQVLTTRKRAVTNIAERPQTRCMSNDEEALSEKVRAFYSYGTDVVPEQDDNSVIAKRLNLRWQDAVQDRRDSLLTASRATSATDISKLPPSPTFVREDLELAGGTEDWQNVDNADVDRYGFIIPKSPTSPTSKHDTAADGAVRRTPTKSRPGLPRVSSSLQLAADTPRRKHTIRRSPSNAQSTKSAHNLGRSPSQVSLRSTKSVNLHHHYSTSRAIANRLPHNKDRRILDEAGDMLTLPRSTRNNSLGRSLTDDVSTKDSDYSSPFATTFSKKKEVERQEKWRKMARPVPAKPGVVGGGMDFTFDTTSPKLIERTWKGIPDTWRASAWFAFLSASVIKHDKSHPNQPCLSDDVLISMYQEYQERNSPDDVQIDIDVPRTISAHIMFRRRYRGGQRLLFRVLHAMSMHFADTGYVQGMAALAASLLAYYQEEKTFIMLVRLWELRGLEKLYKHGFGGLIEALDDFETQWLGQGELKKRLDDLMIGPTAYGTRWYLTLFNYSIPFPSQLRVWDVFMLLGDDEYDAPSHGGNGQSGASAPATTNTTNDNNEKKEEMEKANFGTTLDVLHATSAALIDGMRGILLESDFENAMKVLTSWVPIRDEDLFMRVARAEWKMNVYRRNLKKKS